MNYVYFHLERLDSSLKASEPKYKISSWLAAEVIQQSLVTFCYNRLYPPPRFLILESLELVPPCTATFNLV